MDKELASKKVIEIWYSLSTNLKNDGLENRALVYLARDARPLYLLSEEARLAGTRKWKNLLVYFSNYMQDLKIVKVEEVPEWVRPHLRDRGNGYGDVPLELSPFAIYLKEIGIDGLSDLVIIDSGFRGTQVRRVKGFLNQLYPGIDIQLRMAFSQAGRQPDLKGFVYETKLGVPEAVDSMIEIGIAPLEQWPHPTSQVLRFTYEPPFFATNTLDTKVAKEFDDHLLISFRQGLASSASLQ